MSFSRYTHSSNKNPYLSGEREREKERVREKRLFLLRIRCAKRVVSVSEARKKGGRKKRGEGGPFVSRPRAPNLMCIASPEGGGEISIGQLLFDRRSDESRLRCPGWVTLGGSRGGEFIF